jgi:hypothetical protein
MFGRVPQPHVFHNFIVAHPTLEGDTIKSAIGIALCNEGPGIASDLFLNISVASHPGVRSQLQFETPDPQNWSGTWAFDRIVNLISKPGYRLPPEGRVQPLILQFRWSPPFDQDLEIRGVAGAGGAPPYRFTLHQTAAELTRVYGEYVRLDAAGQLNAARARALQQLLFGYQDDEETR